MATNKNKRYGSSGTKILAGKIYAGERNPTFASPGAWATVAKTMIRENPRLAALNDIVHNMILAPDFEALALSDNPNAIRNTKYLNECFGWGEYKGRGRADRIWEQILNGISQYPSIGFWVQEVLYKYEDGLIWLKDLADMEPDSIQKWNTDKDGELTSIEQYQYFNDSYDKGTEPVPADKVFIVNRAMTGRNWEGIGLLRSCYAAYSLIAMTIDNIGMGTTRWATTIPRVTFNPALVPEGMTDDELEEHFTDANYVAGKLADGSVKNISDTPFTQITTYGEGALDITDKLINLIQHFNKEVSTRYFAQWIDLGVHNTGARSVGEVHYEAFRAMMINFIDEIVSQLSGKPRSGGGLATRLIQMNFYPNGNIPSDELPVIRHTGLREDAIADGIDKLINLINIGVLDKDDPDLVNSIRRLFKLPQIDLEDFDDIAIEPEDTVITEGIEEE